MGGGGGGNIALSLMTQKSQGIIKSLVVGGRNKLKVLGSTFGGGTITLDRFFEGRRDGGVAYAKAKENHPTKRQLFQKLLLFLHFLFYQEKMKKKKSQF
jgi:hypothetical protein